MKRRTKGLLLTFAPLLLVDAVGFVFVDWRTMLGLFALSVATTALVALFMLGLSLLLGD